MRYYQYKFKFYLNASHAIYIHGNLGERHSHTWEIMLHTLKMKENFIEFHHVEERMEGFFETYQGRYLNEVEPFQTMNPTIENCCEYFKQELADLLRQEGWILLAIELSETPTRSYVINLLEDMGDAYEKDLEAMADVILDKLTKGI
ncbi:6-carboxytetrahydropterin synthase [Anaerosporobacter faecicola]|uniref:6-carboxytetrahydropterin synthase n=1 Tax=Anaerosporobacter faecicola TaxID=2718714 RepID=UPI001439EA21|nr:6-carboxytetrahydropterin synthase [Anaerosporobacter faecicola]